MSNNMKNDRKLFTCLIDCDMIAAGKYFGVNM